MTEAQKVAVHLVGGKRNGWAYEVPWVLDPKTWQPRLPASIDPDDEDGEYHLDSGLDNGFPRYVFREVQR